MVGEGMQNYVNMAAGLTKRHPGEGPRRGQGAAGPAGLDEVPPMPPSGSSKLAEEIIAGQPGQP